MSGVYIFGKSTEINTSNSHNNFIYTINPSLFKGFLIQNYIVDKRIELTRVLIQFHGEDAYR